MADDARISTALPQHPKTVKLQRRLGASGCWSLICLFLWVADNRPEGDLQGMTGEDIEIAANWTGEAGTLVGTLAEVRFLDGQDGAYKIHDWAEHNPWAAGRPRRIETARAAANARWEKMRGACESHEAAMPTSPHLSSPPGTTKPNPPLLENDFVHSKEKQFSQSDFDEEALRLFAKARREMELKFVNGWGSNLTDDQIFEHQCALAGKTVKRMREVLARVELEASA